MLAIVLSSDRLSLPQKKEKVPLIPFPESSTAEKKSTQSILVPESAALHWFSSQFSIPQLLLLKRTAIPEEPISLGWGMSATLEPVSILREGLLALGNQHFLLLTPQESSKTGILSEFCERYGVRQMLLLALPKEHNRVSGFLLAGFSGKPFLDSKSVRQIREAFEQEGGALRGWLFCEIAKSELELAKEKGRVALLALAEGLQDLCLSRDHEQLQRQILRLAVQMIDPAQSGGLFFIEEGEIRIKELVGIDPGPFPQIRLAPGEGLPGKVFASKKSIRLVSRAAVLATAANLTPKNREIFVEAFRPFGIPSSAIAAPLLVHGEPVGVMVLDTVSESRSFSAYDLEFLQHFANLSAAVYDNRRLFALAQLRGHLLDQIQDAVLTLDAEGRVQSYNSGAKLLWGETFHLDRQSFFQLFDPSCESLVELALSEAKKKQYWSGELTLREGVDSKPPVLVSVSTVESGRTKLFVVIVTNLSEHKRYHSLLLQASKMETISNLAGGLAHDFNNFLGIISGYASLLKSRFSEDAQAIEEIEGIEGASGSASELTAKLLAIRRGGKTRELKPHSLDVVLGKSLKILHSSLGAKIQFRFECADALPQVRCDPVQIEEVLLNLALNSKEAMPDGGEFLLSLSACTREELAPIPGNLPGENWVRIVVSDNGCGMSSDVLARLFEPFFTTKESSERSGLGCTMIYFIVRTHGGWVEVDSQLGQGTLFRIYLPAV